MANAERMLTQLRSKPVDFSRRRRKRIGACKDFQRNLIVIDYPGTTFSAVQVLHDYDKVYQGVLLFNTKMSEDEIREEISELIHQETSDMYDLSSVCPADFEFVKCINRRVRALGGKAVFDGNGL